jgi:hypothetical protein
MNLEGTVRFMTRAASEERKKEEEGNLHFLNYEKFHKLRFQVSTAVNITNIDYIIK